MTPDELRRLNQARQALGLTLLPPQPVAAEDNASEDDVESNSEA